MAYRPKTIQSVYKRGDSGIANVQVSGSHNKVRVTFEETDEVVITTDFPKGMKAGKWFVTLNSENNKVLGYRPINGMFTGKVQKFVAKEGDSPAPQTKIAKNQQGSTYSYQYFAVLLEITQGNNKGLVVPCMLRYQFGQAEEDGKQVVAYTNPKSKYNPVLVSFCDVTGVWNKGIMQFKDNILPAMEKRILHEDKEFNFVMKNGYVSDFIPSDHPVSEEIPEEDEEQGIIVGQ